jgi:hypothetical protein
MVTFFSTTNREEAKYFSILKRLSPLADTLFMSLYVTEVLKYIREEWVEVVSEVILEKFFQETGL